jgi:uncharacterized protein (TIGR00369 family)
MSHVEQNPQANINKDPQKEGKRIHEVTLAKYMGPNDANNMGNVHGGVLMRLMDEAGALCAIKHTKHPAVTVVVDSIEFMKPVYEKDLVTFKAHLTYVGNKSMEAEINVEAENFLTDDQPRKTNKAYIVYVALDEDKRPIEVPPLILASKAERERFEQGRKRQTERLIRKEQSPTL